MVARFTANHSGVLAESDQLGSHNVQEPGHRLPPRRWKSMPRSFRPQDLRSKHSTSRSMWPQVFPLRLALTRPYWRRPSDSQPAAGGGRQPARLHDDGVPCKLITFSSGRCRRHWCDPSRGGDRAFGLGGVACSKWWQPCDSGRFRLWRHQQCPGSEEEAPGAAGWRVPAFPNFVFLNLTPRINAPGVKRWNADMADLLAHEGISPRT